MGQTFLPVAGLVLAGAGCRTSVPVPEGAAVLRWTPISRIEATVSEPAPNGPLRTNGGMLLDGDGRSVLLRGINVSGSCKLPAMGAEPAGSGRFEPNRAVSYVGRPFPLSEARSHFARLASWGFHTVRLPVTWEAVEGRAPGRFDEAYLGYLRGLVALADEAGLRVLVDFHQDVWSRFTGGDGAPRWTLEEAGFDVDRLRASGAALFADQYEDQKRGVPWMANHERLACATMFTLFFAGEDFAPGRRAHDGSSLQQFLQDHYLMALERVARSLRPCPNVIGFDVMNEPGAGFIGRTDLEETGVFALDVAPTPLQAMAAGSGIPQTAGDHRITALGPLPTGWSSLNEPGVRAWREGVDCVWKEQGVWGLDRRGRPQVLAPRYFAEHHGRPVDFLNDYYQPFVERCAARLRAVDPRFLVFIEEPVLPEHPERTGLPDWGGRAPAGLVNASHWYDIATVSTSCYRSWLAVDPGRRALVVGRGAVRRLFDRRLAGLTQETSVRSGRLPLVVGEFGIAFPKSEGRGPGKPDLRDPEEALDCYFGAFERARVGHLLWHYGPGSTTDGDGWNHEDFAIYRNDGTDGRALDAVIRPYALAVPGALLESSFDPARGLFRCRFPKPANQSPPALIFLPEAVYGNNFEVGTNGGSLHFDRRTRFLAVRPGPGTGDQIVVVRRSRSKQRVLGG